MKSYLLSLIILIISFYISFQKNSEIDISNLIFPKIEEKIKNYSNLKEWISQLMIEIPNDLINNVTQGMVEDLTIYGICLDKLITTNPEVIDNKIGLNISLTNAGFSIRGVFTLFSLNKVFTAHVSRLNAQLPFYLVRDPESGLVKEVDTNGLNIDFENIDIELELNVGDLLRDIVINVLKEVLLALKPEVIEPSLVELFNSKIGGLFQKMNEIITNEAEPKKLNITIKEEDILDLKKSTLISGVAYLLNNLTGADGPLSLNSLLDIITFDTGIVRLHEFYNKSINFEFNLTDKNIGSLGNYEIGLEDLNISGLNTWKNFTALEPYNKILLHFYTYLQNLTINASLSIKVKLDNSSNISSNETILYEKAIVSTNLKNNSLKAFLQLPIDNKKTKEYSSKECLNFNCILGLVDSNGTGITALSLNESFSYILLHLDRQGELEDDLNVAIDKLIDLFLSSFDDKIGLLINGLLNKTGIDFVNKQINNYLYSNYCNRIPDTKESEINTLITSIAFLSAFILFILIILGPYILGKTYKKERRKKINENLIDEENNKIANTSEIKNVKNYNIEPKYIFPGITVQWIKELGRIDPRGASLFLHPDISIFWRIFIPFAILATMSLFISSNSATGASVYIALELGRRIQIPSLFNFGLINSVRDMWKAGVYFLAVIVAAFSGFWPYAKLILMLISFILPASLFNKKKRGNILMVLDALGKWSILDSYVMILMLVAFHFHIEIPVVEPSEANEGSVIDVFVYAAFGFLTLIVGTLISLCLSHIITHLHRSLDEHPDQNKGEKAESYKALISFAENKYLGKIFFRIFVTILLFSTLALVIIGSFTTSFSFYFHGLAGYALDLFDISPHRDYSIIDLGLSVPKSYENPNDKIIRFTQIIYFLTIFVMPIAMLLNVIFLWLVPLPRKAQKILYTIVEILNAWSCLDVFVLAIISALLQIGQFTKFIVGDKCDTIDPFIAKYFYKILDGHNTCFEVKAYLNSGCWILFAATIIFLISSNIVMRVCRNALKERMPQHVKEYLKNLADGGRAESISNFNEYENNEKKKDVFNELNSNEKISRINDSRSSNTTNNL